MEFLVTWFGRARRTNGRSLKPGFAGACGNLATPEERISSFGSWILWFPWRVLPCLIFEDDHLLAVNKPAGLNTHAPGPYGGEGLYDWLRHREPRWANLAIIHRLDKETSGVMVFAKTPLASRSLTAQFTNRTVRKKYLLLTDRKVGRKEFTVRTTLVRAGDKYLSRPLHAGGTPAETHFRLVSQAADQAPGIATRERATKLGGSADTGGVRMVEAEPLTGRTHQIRVHAAEQGFPVLGDTLYGGTPARRACLHAAELTVCHPATGEPLILRAPVDFSSDGRVALRTGLLDPEATTAWRLIHGASDGWPGWQVDRLGDYLLSQSERPLDEAQDAQLRRLLEAFSARGAYHKRRDRQVRGASAAEASPQLMLGQAAPEHLVICENGVKFELSFNEGYSVGLFLDQRDNRRRLRRGHIAAGFSLEGPQRPIEILNAFAYTCGFSVCAAKAGARTTSLDLSKKYLEWGRRNFGLNDLDVGAHDFIYGDAFDWFRRLHKKGRDFDVVLLDPPTFSKSRETGLFRAESDYGKLVKAALPLLKTGGVLFASTNAANWPAEEFLAVLDRSVCDGKRSVLQRHYVPQPPDFPICRAEPAYLKTVWLRIG
jgi:23S rRNA (cytosine1962-C5)-methyltransferase